MIKVSKKERKDGNKVSLHDGITIVRAFLMPLLKEV
nr:MAG TPA: hypothetical protein [Caudoviricetes sp.]